jgi:hypothetical protein
MPVPITIFAARVHAHGLGTVVTSYKYDPKVGIQFPLTTFMLDCTFKNISIVISRTRQS